MRTYGSVTYIIMPYSDISVIIMAILVVVSLRTASSEPCCLNGVTKPHSS